MDQAAKPGVPPRPPEAAQAEAETRNLPPGAAPSHPRAGAGGANGITDLLLRWEELLAQGTELTAEELCRDCPEQAPEVARRLSALRAVYRALDTDAEARATLPVGPAAPADLPSVPGYEVLGELGRSGMGVVYQARQVRLNRLVALKMVRGGHAGAEELARFRAEAQAVARLQHPNIVQIHEVGEADGKPFFCLEFVAGGSLDKRLSGTPLPAGEAAALVRTLAGAVDYAHRRGVVHRDLKPANILLQRKAEIPNPKSEGGGGAGSDFGFRISDFDPKITDFGLAKQLDGAKGQTQSGAVLGTPSYMAPEQAGGQVGAIGPACDVYALGAILYELLTGRPPFKAATPLDTVLQVVNDEPVPPSRLQPTVPRDLETICLKCLQKEPAKRYARAADLAEDLGRFERREPILARPVGRAERLWRWCRRNPGVAALSAALLLALVSGLVGVTLLWRRAEDERAAAVRAGEEARQQEARARG
jgi:serine/threonine protein kinase